MFTASSRGCKGLRWGLSLTLDDELDSDVVLETVECMITAYPDLSKGPLADFQAFLAEANVQ